MRLAYASGPLLIIALLLAAPPATASTASVSEHLTQLELRELSGLKALFLRLHRRLEAQFGDTRLNRNLLESPEAYRHLLNRSSTSQQRQMKQAYIQLLGEWEQFQQVAAQVLGIPDSPASPSYPHSFDAFINGAPFRVGSRDDSVAMDRLVARMEMLGYTTREIADVISGNISLQALNKSGQMRALGHSEESIAAYLQRHYKGTNPAPGADSSRFERAATLAVSHTSAPARVTHSHSGQRQQLEGYVERYARIYGIDANLVRAVIDNESSWRIKALSSAGAVGPMQLMPSTATSLGVDPHDPEQNIEGGVRYLAELLELFDGDLDAVLVSYNAGPGHARNWRQGKSVLYGETRNYLQRVKRSYASLGF